jgi:hypothetical protein
MIMTVKATAMAQSTRAPPTAPPTIAPMLGDGPGLGSSDVVVVEDDAGDEVDVVRVKDVEIDEVVGNEGAPMSRGTSVIR